MARRAKWHVLLARITREKAALLGLLLALLFGLVANGALHAGNFDMSRLGAGSGLIGYATAAQALGIVMAAPLMALLTRGGRRVNLALISGGIAGVGFLGIFFAKGIVLMFAARFLFGCGIGLGMAFTEYVVVSQVRRDVRPVFAMLFGILLAGGHAFGTLLTGWIGGSVLLQVLTLATVAGAVMLAPWGYLKHQDDRFAIRDLPRILALSPATFLAALVFGFLDNGLLTMLPDFLWHSGIERANAVSTSFAAFAGICAFQIPAGMLAMRVSPLVLLRAAVLGLIAAVIGTMVAADITIVRLTMAFVMGGMVDVIYTIGLISMATQLPRNRLAAGNACFVSLCGIGEVTGPAVTGPALDNLGLAGGAGVVLLLLAAFWAGSSYRSAKAAAIVSGETDFPPLGLAERRAGQEVS